MGILQFLKRHYTPRNCLFFLFFVMTVFYVWAKIRQKEFAENRGFSTARIIGHSFPYNKKYNDPTFNYVYTVDGKVYGGSEHSYMAKKSNAYRLDGKYFPVVYNKLHPERSCLIILPEEFSFYKLEQPDSLKWVNDIVW